MNKFKTTLLQLLKSIATSILEGVQAKRENTQAMRELTQAIRKRSQGDPRTASNTNPLAKIKKSVGKFVAKCDYPRQCNIAHHYGTDSQTIEEICGILGIKRIENNGRKDCISKEDSAKLADYIEAHRNNYRAK